MKTRKQVMGEFARLQKKYVEVPGFVVLKSYESGPSSGYWSVTLVVTAFENREIIWKEEVDWKHFSSHDEAAEARNEAKVEAFLKRMEERLS